jgi:diguanylate cyclase (GGDEF)-like protein
MGDVNGLKLINDSFGHIAGDILLKEIAKIIKNACREEDFVARIGGDEFVVFLNQTDAMGAEKVCSRIYKACKDYVKNNNKKTFYLSISLGFATKLRPSQSIEEMLNEAEDMLYKRKNSEKKKVRKTIMEAVKNELVLKSNQSESQHNQLVKISIELGEKLNLSTNKLKELELLMEIHDIGKLTLSEDLPPKDISKFSKEELFEYNKHSENGYRIALGVPELKHIAEEILSHHEHWDGTGFPKGISGERIPFLSRIVCVIDTYDELTKGSKLKNKKEHDKVMELMSSFSGTYFDPEVIKEFTEVMKKDHFNKV